MKSPPIKSTTNSRIVKRVFFMIEFNVKRQKHALMPGINFRRINSMKILSVFGTTPQVIKKLQTFLDENRFSKIIINQTLNEITAERTVLLLWKDYIHIRVSPALENISNIELKVNPVHPTPTAKDE